MFKLPNVMWKALKYRFNKVNKSYKLKQILTNIFFLFYYIYISFQICKE